MGISCGTGLHTHPPTCRCGHPVTRDDMVRTVTGATYYICQDCWSAGRRRWFRPDSKAERIAALERVEAAA